MFLFLEMNKIIWQKGGKNFIMKKKKYDMKW